MEAVKCICGMAITRVFECKLSAIITFCIGSLRVQRLNFPDDCLMRDDDNTWLAVMLSCKKPCYYYRCGYGSSIRNP